jgi:hypothetical protein
MTNMQKKPHDIFNDFKFVPGTSVLKGKLPDAIFEEVKEMVEIGRKIKDHPLAYLKHIKTDVGNVYRNTVDIAKLEQSFLMPLLIFLGEYYINKTTNISLDNLNKKVKLKQLIGHHDKYDVWINYSYKGDIVPIHQHGSFMSGNIFIQNEEKAKTIFQHLNGVYQGCEVGIVGEPGEIIIFPANLPHYVPTLKEDKERITMTFNLNKSED